VLWPAFSATQAAQLFTVELTSGGFVRSLVVSGKAQQPAVVSSALANSARHPRVGRARPSPLLLLV